MWGSYLDRNKSVNAESQQNINTDFQDLKDSHKKLISPELEKAYSDAVKMFFLILFSKNSIWEWEKQAVAEVWPLLY